uniref:Cytochrome P450 n=1 Tax=Clastoptera arizonana TaxID=38151 RepID=A0A1B6CBB7_9HEMI
MFYSFYLSVLAFLLFIFLWKRKQFKHNYPPGFPNWPILGSLPHLKDADLLHFAIKDWAKKYGQVISVHLGLHKGLFVTGADNVLAALRKPEFQGRPDSHTIRERSFGQKSLGVFFSEGDHWSSSRKFTVRQLRAFGAVRTEEFMAKEIIELVDSIQDGVEQEITGLFALSVVNFFWFIIASRRFKPDDKMIKLFLAGNKSFFRNGNPKGSTADVFPILKHFDKSYQSRLQHIRKTQRLVKELIEEQRSILDKNNPVNLIDHYLVEISKGEAQNDFTEEGLIMICFDIFSAGAEPVSAAFDFILLYMVLYPEVQKKMQEEIDAVLGKSRRPMLEDKNSLHYTMAVIEEVTRTNPTAPIAVPHKCTTNTYFNDYYVEQDTMVLLDLHSLGFDEKYWKNPDVFQPERFLDADGKFKKSNILYPFGIGQRSCAGETISKNLIFLFVATFFEKFTLSLPKNAPKPSTMCDPGFTIGCKPFKAVITSRY